MWFHRVLPKAFLPKFCCNVKAGRVASHLLGLNMVKLSRAQECIALIFDAQDEGRNGVEESEGYADSELSTVVSNVMCCFRFSCVVQYSIVPVINAHTSHAAWELHFLTLRRDKRTCHAVQELHFLTLRRRSSK